MAGLDDVVGKAKEMLGQHDEQVDAAIDKASEAAQQVAPDQLDGAIDAAAQKAKDAT